MGTRQLWPTAGRQFGAVFTGSRVSVKPDTAYQTNPIGWLVDVLKFPEHTIRWSLNPGYEHHRWDGTPDPLAAICDGLAAGKDVGVESATGTGKTYLAAGLVLWFTACFENALVVTVAPKEAQLTAMLWKEIGRLFPRFRARFPSAQKGELVLRMRPDADDRDVWTALGWACGVEAGAESTTKAQGFHAEHMLMITEETPGIPVPTMTALGNTSIATHNIRLALGNPDAREDALHQFCIRPGVVHVQISAFDHPNVVLQRDLIPGAQSPKGLADLAQKWELGSPMYESRARGICPAQGAHALIRREWCDAAVERYHEPALRRGKGAKGVDAAQSENGDRAAIADWRGQCLLGVRAFQCPNATDLGTQVYEELARDDVEPWYVGVDSIGLGTACANELDRLTHFAIQKLYAADPAVQSTQRAPDGREYDWAPDAGQYANLRAQMWWQMREDLREGRIALPNNRELINELTTPTYREVRGRVQIEEKAQIKKRLGGKSPDLADAAVMGNWVRHRAKEPDPTDDVILDINHPDVLRAAMRRCGNVRPPGTYAGNETGKGLAVDDQFGEY